MMFFIIENTIRVFEPQLRLGIMLLVLQLVLQMLMVVLVFEKVGDFQQCEN
jgi:hypothetical protein